MSKPSWEYEKELAALTATLAEVKHERDEQGLLKARVNNEREAAWRIIDKLQQQLATVTVERDRLDALTSMQSGSFEMLHNQIADLHDQLATARREAFEEAARLSANRVRVEESKFDVGYNRACEELESLLNDQAKEAP